ncbi:hypothetical protein [Andreprevotia chitinilytica]|uniref:hypothetical protein n=1 Tax=Andreprevotia chitinilytica TaxID=396808 RepID=UPI0005547DF3|nr:hypothetical protein [Andreprevotia chitinilytica]
MTDINGNGDGNDRQTVTPSDVDKSVRFEYEPHFYFMTALPSTPEEIAQAWHASETPQHDTPITASTDDVTPNRAQALWAFGYSTK